MRAMTVGEIAAACGGEILRGAADTVVTHVSIDSRDVPGGTLFVPLIGEKTDAHRFIGQVAAQGAVAALTAEGDPFLAGGQEEGAEHFSLIAVQDTLQALQALGAACRSRVRLPLVGVTGSVGKTTTREMIAAALSAGLSVYKTPSNHNGQIGVPLTLMEIGEKDEIGVIEMGMSMPGEMGRISQLVRPDVAVFTNIGLAHIEQLGTQENIREEKLHIQDGMPDNAVLFLNGEDPLLRECAIRPGFRRVFYGRDESCDVRAEEIHLQEGCACFTALVGGKRIPVRLHVYGEHQVLNALAALAVASHFGVDLFKAAEKLSEFRGYRHRQQIFSHCGVTVVDDSYNASPDSMRAALDILSGLDSANRRIAVLADMKELGSGAELLHREIGRYIGENRKAELLFTLGSLAEFIAAEVRAAAKEIAVYSFQEREALEAALRAEVREGDAVLFKGSNSMQLSQLADRMSGNSAEMA